MAYRTVLPLVACLSLYGCASYQWSKPGATQEEFNGDRYECMTEAARSYPTALTPVQVTQGYVTPAMTSCNTTGTATDVGPYTYGSANTNCMTTGGQYVPPTYMNVDANANNRNQAARQCMIAHGYQIVRVCNSHCIN